MAGEIADLQYFSFVRNRKEVKSGSNSLTNLIAKYYNVGKKEIFLQLKEEAIDA